MSSWIC